MPRVAIVNDVAGVAQLEVAGLRAEGWDAEFHDLPKPGATWPRWFKPLAFPVRVLLALPVIWRLRRGRYDVVHVHFLSQGFVGAASGRPFFLHAHGSDLHLNFTRSTLVAWSRLWMRRARGIFYVTPNLRPYLEGYLDKSRLIPNPVDVERFASIAPPSRLERVLVFMRLDRVKGPEAVFDIAESLAQVVHVAALRWGALAPKLEAQHGASVEFIPRVPEADVPRLIAAYDAVIGQMAQGVMGLSELQAMAAGRPVLMRLDEDMAGGDPPPVVRVSGGTELLERVAALRGDAETLNRLSAAGRDWVERHHSLRTHARALIEAYRSNVPAQPPAAR